MPPITEVSQVLRFLVPVLLVGTTLGNDVGVAECWTVAGMGGCDGTDSGTVNCGGVGDCITLGSGAGTERSSGREVCWRKMLLSWSS
jgi:hypothetical protein